MVHPSTFGMKSSTTSTLFVTLKRVVLCLSTVSPRCRTTASLSFQHTAFLPRCVVKPKSAVFEVLMRPVRWLRRCTMKLCTTWHRATIYCWSVTLATLRSRAPWAMFQMTLPSFRLRKRQRLSRSRAIKRLPTLPKRRCQWTMLLVYLRSWNAVSRTLSVQPRMTSATQHRTVKTRSSA